MTWLTLLILPPLAWAIWRLCCHIVDGRWHLGSDDD